VSLQKTAKNKKQKCVNRFYNMLKTFTHSRLQPFQSLGVDVRIGELGKKKNKFNNKQQKRRDIVVLVLDIRFNVTPPGRKMICRYRHVSFLLDNINYTFSTSDKSQKKREKKQKKKRKDELLMMNEQKKCQKK